MTIEVLLLLFVVGCGAGWAAGCALGWLRARLAARQLAARRGDPYLYRRILLR